MKNPKKILFECFFAGILMALAWSLRGQFGHLKGAMIPGACLAILPAFCMREEHWRESFGRAVILTAAGFAAGGHLSYGAFFDTVVQASAFGQIKKELFDIFCVGLIWGASGATFWGFGFSEKSLNRLDVLMLATVILAWTVLPGLPGLGFLDMPLLIAGTVFLQAYNFVSRKSQIVWMAALTGALAWSMAFLFSGLVLSAGYQEYFGQGWAWWALRDQILGFTAGFLFWGMISSLQNFKFRRQPAEDILTPQRFGFFVLVLVIPLINAWNAVTYWLSFKSLESMWQPVSMLCLLLFSGAGILLSRPDADFLHPKLRRTLALSARFFLIYLSLTAIAKQYFAMDRHWEDAYTLFIAFILLLEGMIPFQLKKIT